MTHDGVTGLRYWRAGSPEAPLLLFLPGGGHMARIAYGVDGADSAHFLDHWLAQAGWGMLALSFPTDHPDVASPAPDLLLREWCRWIAAITTMAVEDNPGRKIYAALWSMAGRSSHALAAAFIEQGLQLEGVISLAATPPLGGLMPLTPGGEPLNENHLWAIAPIEGQAPSPWTSSFLAALAAQREQSGADICSDALYVRAMLCNTPIMLRGTAQRIRERRVEWDQDAADRDMRVNEPEAAPLAAALIPTDPVDGVHVLTDAAAWAFVTAQAIRGRWEAVGRPTAHWGELTALAAGAPARLTRSLPGGHFFFVGAPGARATTAAILELAANLSHLRDEIEYHLAENS